MLNQNSWQKFNACPFDKVAVAHRAAHGLPLPILLPVDPRAMSRRVIDELVQIRWHSDAIGANLRSIVVEHRPRDDEHVSPGTPNIVPRVLLNLCPCSAVVLSILWNDVREAETLGHRRRGGHISGGGEVATAVA